MKKTFLEMYQFSVYVCLLDMIGMQNYKVKSVAHASIVGEKSKLCEQLRGFDWCRDNLGL